MEPAISAKKKFSRVGLALFLIAAVTISIQLGLSILPRLLQEITGRPFERAPWMLWVASFAPMYLIAIPLGLLVLRTIPVVKAPSCALGGKNFWIFLLMCFPLMYGGNLIGTFLSLALSNGTAQNSVAELVSSTSILKVLVVVLLAPPLEEIIFRKQIIDRLARYGEKQAVEFSALMFGLFHMNLYQFFYAFAIGLLFGYVYLRTRRLRYSVLLHMILNFMGGVIAPYIASQAAVLGSGTVQLETSLPSLLLTLGYVLLLLGLSVAGLIVLVLMARKLVFVPAHDELPKAGRFSTIYCNAGVLLFSVLCLLMFVAALFVT